ncbi:GrpB-like predicted nucleotidyltransferase (UPF0157 family) [Actinoalloteichus hoggarensis]|uniref:Dephospho-CoA kinase/protein folding accessory domain-containing protein n=1 Tax=Actinoalloteichus hoggarensis TaxID=1470176 RepID=A0A221W5Q9_9PSEU|nr:GrpB family protein [Actinoalloteichus hoggarensis]ASO21024.1 dephospho-CoA kinase/protein folding accessory domain-containing protein [Actinoalloteichus hoggarensis]MBB5920955.1 GrpB-like predicted nucleotidyltransferase (UPF0157 family) [Actinoalloteichus hoggarensis]
MTDSVEIVDHDSRWSSVFEELRTRISRVLGFHSQRVEHVGSTAVPGLAARPIVDLDVVIADERALAPVIGRLRPLGYTHQGDLGVPGREAFTRPPHRPPPHHLYVCTEDSLALARHLAFRDQLRRSTDTAAAYAELKRTLAARHPDDAAAYVEGKTAFISQVLDQVADAARAEHPVSDPQGA